MDHRNGCFVNVDQQDGTRRLLATHDKWMCEIQLIRTKCPCNCMLSKDLALPAKWSACRSISWTTTAH
eukprot:2890858-Amphidinium_carterae.2